jgi:hypothetical protein
VVLDEEIASGLIDVKCRPGEVRLWCYELNGVDYGIKQPSR